VVVSGVHQTILLDEVAAVGTAPVGEGEKRVVDPRFTTLRVEAGVDSVVREWVGPTRVDCERAPLTVETSRDDSESSSSSSFDSTREEVRVTAAEVVVDSSSPQAKVEEGS